MKQSFEIVKEINRKFGHEDCRGLIATFTTSGIFQDSLGVYRNLINEQSIPRMKRAIDYTISETRRHTRYPFAFVPFAGGSREFQVSFHIHALIEVPADINEEDFEKTISKKYQNQTFKLLPAFVSTSKVWFKPLINDWSKKYVRYSARNESMGFDNADFGDEKVLVDMKSFLLWN